MKFLNRLHRFVAGECEEDILFYDRLTGTVTVPSTLCPSTHPPLPPLLTLSTVRSKSSSGDAQSRGSGDLPDTDAARASSAAVRVELLGTFLDRTQTAFLEFMLSCSPRAAVGFLPLCIRWIWSLNSFAVTSPRHERLGPRFSESVLIKLLVLGSAYFLFHFYLVF